MRGGSVTLSRCGLVAAGIWASLTRTVDAQTPVQLVELRTEYQASPLGLDVRAPRLSWKIESSRRGTVQTAYEIRVAPQPSALQRHPLWDSGKVVSDASIHGVYGGPALESGQRYYWQVRVWDGEGRPSAWSSPAYWEMGLLRPSDWTADWITPELTEDTTASNPSPMLRSEFMVGGTIASARAYVTSLGLYEMELNGRRVGDQLFTPGWTAYDKRLQYQTYDVTELLKPGANAVGVTLGDGWYRGRLAWGKQRGTYGTRLALLAQIVIRYADGHQQVIGTGNGWKAATGPVRWSDIYDGESYDARREQDGWTRAGFKDANWAGVRMLDHSKQILIAPAGPPVRRIQEMKPVKLLVTPAGDTVFDMGQNMVGWVRLKVRGPRGATVRLRHAEVLDRKGDFYTDNLRSARQTVEYTLRGGGEEVYEPHFTFQGFRYVAVAGYPGTPTLDAITGIVIHSDMTPTGTFETSNPLLNQLQHNIVWGQKGNFLDVPTDCPQRDERLGWTGDAQVFSRTAAFNMDVAGFFTKWLADLAADQKASGSVPHVIPDVLSRGQAEGGGSTGWADASVIVPWTVYLVYGDTRILETQYESMRAWVEYMRRQAGDDLILDSGFHYGDWLAFHSTRADYPGATTDKDLIATAFFAHSTSLLARAAAVLGRTEQAREYRALFERIKVAFDREYVTATGRLASNTQTAYALALAFDLVPDAWREQAVRRLVEDVRRFKHLTTGFLGTPYVNPVLSSSGHLDDAYALLLRDQYPSWLYPIKQGATTIWERWDGQKPDSSFQDPGMNSFNHYAYGAVGAWLYSTVAGIDVDPEQPGYKHVLIRPQPGGGLTRVRASLNTVYGTVASAWEIRDGQFILEVSVPPNAYATARLPHAKLDRVTESGMTLGKAGGIRGTTQAGDTGVVEIGSGHYRFVYVPM